MEPTQTQNKSNGALVGSIIIIVIILVGGIYLWKTSMKEKAAETNTSGTSSSTAAGIDTEMNNMDMDNLDNGL